MTSFQRLIYFHMKFMNSEISLKAKKNVNKKRAKQFRPKKNQIELQLKTRILSIEIDKCKKNIAVNTMMKTQQQ